MEFAARVPYHPHTTGRRLPPGKYAAVVVAAAVALGAAIHAALPGGHAGGAPSARLESPRIQSPVASRAGAEARPSTASAERGHAAAGSTSTSAARPAAHAARTVRLNPVTGLPYGKAPKLAENVAGDYDPVTDSYVNQGSYGY